MTEEKIMWSDNLTDVFKNEINSDHFKEHVDHACREVGKDINNSIEIFTNALYAAAACMVRTTNRKKSKCNEWFDKECREQRTVVERLLKSFQRAKSETYKKQQKELYVKERTKYTGLKRDKKRKFDEIRLEKIKKATPCTLR
eukprot:TRINITY_DN9585_c0_g1_i3.p1 TRINITY_DN9585_c0_g1~~TRINITY_DN9585_c0_g1_i3.p1  ORF type:complete len:166 (+),score=28.83 TRINITY_DN9585_c0_g1_i3:70-498(+)